MKLTVLLITVAILQVSAATYAQKVTLSEKNAPLEKVLKSIKQQTGYYFLYNTELLKQAKPLTIQVKDAELTDVLKQCFDDSPFSFEIQDKTILIKVKKEEKVKLENPAPPINVKGRVIDSLGNPLSGASIRIKLVKDGKEELGDTYITDQDGRFVIKNCPDNVILVASFVGYKSREFSPVSEVSIMLKQEAGSLKEVAITYNNGYQSIPQERATGSFAQPDKVMFDKRVTTDILSRLTGITSGVYGSEIIRNTPPSLAIRGVSTLNANGSPLIVVDNFPYDGDITNINPNDIESVTVLKDAAAASIWGARAGNGVIVLTTKKGRFNEPVQVDFTANLTTSKPTDIKSGRHWINTSDFIDLEKQFFNAGLYDNDLTSPDYVPESQVVNILAKQRSGQLTNDQANAQLNALRGLDVRNDIQKYFYRNPVTQQYAVNMQGGARNVRIASSFGYDKSLSEQVGNSNDRITATMQTSFKPLKNLEITGGINYVQQQIYNNSTLGDATDVGGPTGRGISPYTRFADDQGNPLPIQKIYSDDFIQTIGNPSHGFLNWQYFPLLEQGKVTHTNSIRDTRLQAGATYTIIPGLSIQGNYQYQVTNSNIHGFYGDSSWYVRNLINQYSTVSGSNVVTRNIPDGAIYGDNQESTGSNTYKSGRGQINFDHSFGIHQINAIGGFEVRENTGLNTPASVLYGYNDATSQSVGINPFTTYDLFPGYLGQHTIPYNTNPQISTTTNRFRSLFGNVAYSYNNLYTISASARSDQANIFGVKANDRRVPLWSVGGKWNINREGFYNLTWLPSLQFRLTYGVSGNMVNTGIGAAYNVARYTPGTPGLYPNSSTILVPGNTALTWEKSKMLNLALDFGLKKDKLYGSIEFYSKRGTNLIGYIPIASSTGFGAVQANYGDMQGSGVDLVLNSVNLRTNQFNWKSSLLFNFVTDKVTKYNNTQYGGVTALVGKPVGALYANRWGGLDPSNGDPRGVDSTGQVSKDYASLNAYTIANKKYIGRTTPNIFGGFRNTLEYKSLSLSFNITYAFGYFFMRNSISYSSLIYGGADVGHTDYYNRWQKTGDEVTTNVPSISLIRNDARDAFYSNSEVLATKADNIRLQDASLFYSLPVKYSKAIKARNIQVGIYTSNLGVLWRANKQGIDPAIGDSYALPKSWALSLKAGF